MARPNVSITLKNGIVDVGVLTPDIRVEVRDYDIQSTEDRGQLWMDKQGKQCLRYFVSSVIDQDTSDPVINDLERFANDLQTHASITTTFTPDSSPDGLHVVNINNTDYYFETYTGKYDGWGAQAGGNKL